MKAYYKQKIISAKIEVASGRSLTFEFPQPILEPNGPGANVVFRCSDGEIRAHKDILVSGDEGKSKSKSAYFDTMFQSGFKESKDPTIQVDQFTVAQFRLLLDYLYGSVTINYADWIILFAMAHRYAVHSLVEMLVIFFQKQMQTDAINIENLIEILDTPLGTALMSYPEVHSQLAPFINSHFADILLNDGNLFKRVFSEGFFNRNEYLAKILISVIDTWEAPISKAAPLPLLLMVGSSYPRVNVFIDIAHGRVARPQRFFEHSIFCALEKPTIEYLSLVLSKIPDSLKDGMSKAVDQNNCTLLDVAVSKRSPASVCALLAFGVRRMRKFQNSFSSLMQSDDIDNFTEIVGALFAIIDDQSRFLQAFLLWAINAAASRITEWLLEKEFSCEQKHVLAAALKFEQMPTVFEKIIARTPAAELVAPILQGGNLCSLLAVLILKSESTVMPSPWRNSRSIVSIVRTLKRKGGSLLKADYESIGPVHFAASESTNHALIKCLFDDDVPDAVLVQKDIWGSIPGDYGMESVDENIKRFIRAEYGARKLPLTLPSKVISRENGAAAAAAAPRPSRARHRRRKPSSKEGDWVTKERW